MILKVFSIYDSKAEAFSNPECIPSKGEAIRGFAAAANNPQTQIGKYPADFTLFEIGEYDTDTGTVTMSQHKQNWGTAIEHKSPVEPAAFQQPVKLAEANNA